MSYAYDFNAVPGPDAATIVANGGDGALVYGTGMQQDPAYIARLEAAGLHVPLIWEHNVDSILGGYDYGVSECRAWEGTHRRGLVYLACDLNDGALGDRDAVPFIRGWCDTTREPCVGVYGPDHLLLRSHEVSKWQRLWGVVNWLDGGHADNDPRNIARWGQIGAHLIQLIGSPIDNTDQNLVLDAAWWTTGEAPPEVDDNMDIFKTTDEHGKITYYRDARGYLVPLTDPAPFYGARVRDLGGTLGAVAYNEATRASLTHIGVAP